MNWIKHLGIIPDTGLSRGACVYRLSCIALLYLAVASIMVNVYFDIMAASLSHNINDVLAYRVDRPFAYRLLPAWLINGIYNLIPQSIVVKVESSIPNPIGAMEYYAWHDNSRITFILAYALCTGSLYILLWSLRSLLGLFDFSPAIVDIAPVIGTILLAMTFKNGAYLYDFPEIVLAALMLYFCLRSQWAIFNLLLIVAITNKESSILFPIIILTLKQLDLRRRLKLFTLSIIVGSATFLTIRWLKLGVPGTEMAMNVWINLAYLANPRNWLLFDATFAPGIPFPRTINVVNLLLLIPCIYAARKHAPSALTSAFLALFAPLFILYLVGGWRDEIRVFGSLFPLAFILAVFSAAGGYATLSTPQRAKLRL